MFLRAIDHCSIEDLVGLNVNEVPIGVIAHTGIFILLGIHIVMNTVASLSDVVSLTDLHALEAYII